MALRPTRPAVILAVLGLALITLTYALHRQRPGRLPALRLHTLDGETLNLGPQPGTGATLVVFWATTCPPCVAEIPDLIGLYRALAPRGLRLLAISMRYDPPNRVVALRDRLHIPYPLVLDLDGRLAQAFGGVQLVPTLFLADRRGRVLLRRTGRLDPLRMRRRIDRLLMQREG